jgi:hypothetical protein
VKDTHITIFSNWCNHNNIEFIINDEKFFVGNGKILKPEFKLVNKYYLIIPSEIDESDRTGYQFFGIHHGELIVIPRNELIDFCDAVDVKQFQEYLHIVLTDDISGN